MCEEDLQLEFLSWPKAQKRVSTKTAWEYINSELFATEGRNLRLVKYRLSLPISMTNVNVRMRKLGCAHERASKSYYIDGHERSDVREARSAYTRQKRRLQLRPPCWVRV